MMFTGAEIIAEGSKIFIAEGESNNEISADKVLKRIDANMSAQSIVMESKMIIHTPRSDREITSKSFLKDEVNSFTEYLSPEREKGTKMLKLQDRLWIYSPSTDRTIQISGHMLRQSVMGSDLSYEDMMEKRKLYDIYSAELAGHEDVDGRECVILMLTAKVSDVAYFSRKLWVDSERFIPLREELFAKSGQLLKRTDLGDVKRIDGRWYPMKMTYKDMLKKGKGTDFVVLSIEFNSQIPESVFSKGMLTR